MGKSRWGAAVVLSSLFSIPVSVATDLLSVAAFSEYVQSQTESQQERPQFRGFLPLTNFYSTPRPLPFGQPGELIRSEEFDEYQLPEGVSAFRILYHSRSASGRDVAASGVVLTPDQPPPTGGWPVIAWAHGFTGIARHCAPSLMRNLNDGPFLTHMSSWVMPWWQQTTRDWEQISGTRPSICNRMRRT